MKVLVCGSRTFTDDELLYEVLNEINGTYDLRSDISEIIHGGARGADTLAGTFAGDFNIPVHVFPALWELYGKSAGPIRNRQMLREGNPDLVIAFITKVAHQEINYGLSDSQHSRGTKNMIKLAKEAGIEVRQYIG